MENNFFFKFTKLNKKELLKILLNKIKLTGFILKKKNLYKRYLTEKKKLKKPLGKKHKNGTFTLNFIFLNLSFHFLNDLVILFTFLKK